MLFIFQIIAVVLIFVFVGLIVSSFLWLRYTKKWRKTKEMGAIYYHLETLVDASSFIMKVCFMILLGIGIIIFLLSMVNKTSLEETVSNIINLFKGKK